MFSISLRKLLSLIVGQLNYRKKDLSNFTKSLLMMKFETQCSISVRDLVADSLSQLTMWKCEFYLQRSNYSQRQYLLSCDTICKEQSKHISCSLYSFSVLLQGVFAGRQSRKRRNRAIWAQLYNSSLPSSSATRIGKRRDFHAFHTSRNDQSQISQQASNAVFVSTKSLLNAANKRGHSCLCSLAHGCSSFE